MYVYIYIYIYLYMYRERDMCIYTRFFPFFCFPVFIYRYTLSRPMYIHCVFIQIGVWIYIYIYIYVYVINYLNI